MVSKRKRPTSPEASAMAKWNPSSNEPERYSDVARRGTDSFVIVKIGQSHEEYKLSRSKLIAVSEYFAKALGDNWKEGQEGIILLEDQETVIFNIFVDWLYGAALPYWRSDWLIAADIDPMPTSKETCFTVELVIMKLYVFSDRLIVPSLQKALERLLSYGLSDLPNLPLITYAFDNLRADDRILEEIVELYCKNWNYGKATDAMKEARQRLPVDFLLRCKDKLHEMASTAK